jgi:hypothetical protein
MLNQLRNGRLLLTVGEFNTANPFLKKYSNKKIEVSYFHWSRRKEIINKASHPNSRPGSWLGQGGS